MASEHDIGLLSTIANWAWTVLSGILLLLFGYQVKTNGTLHKRVNDTNKELSTFKEKVSENYTPKDDFKDAVREIKSALNAGIDRIEKKLDRKADK